MEIPIIPKHLAKFGIKPQNAGTEKLFKPGGKGLHLAGFDTETVGGSLFRKNDLFTVQIIADSRENSHIFFPKKQGIENLDYFFQAISGKGNRVFATAHNAGFDIGALLGKDVFPLMKGEPVKGWTGKVVEGNSSFAVLNNRETGQSITIADSMAWFKMSLAHFAKTFLPTERKLERPPYLGKRLPKTQEELNYFCEYAEQDAVVQFEATRLIYGFCLEGKVRVSLTPSQLAGRVFQKQYLPDRVFLAWPEQLRFIAKTYHGAQFTAFGRGFFEKVRYYDINSLYPYAALKAPLNFSNSKLEKIGLEEIEQGWAGFVKAGFKFPEQDMYPCLPEQRNIRGFPKLVFPRKGITYSTSEEIKRALKKNTEINIYRAIGWYPEEIDIKHPLGEYMMDVYEKKAELDRIKEREPLTEEQANRRNYYKLLLNSLIGKFCQRNRIWLSKKEIAGSLFKPDFGSLVLGKARAVINEHISDNNAIYSDTDSLLTKKGLETGNGMGQLKNELGKRKKGDLLSIRSKLYFVTENGLVLKAAKHGFRMPSQEVFKSLLERRNALSISYSVNRLTRLKESYRRHSLPRREINQSFRIMLADDGKREYDRGLATVNRLLTENTMSMPLQN